MRVDKNQRRVKFRGEEGASFEVYYDNRGEPYRQGIAVVVEETIFKPIGYVFLDDREAKELRDLLNRLYPEPR